VASCFTLPSIYSLSVANQAHRLCNYNCFAKCGVSSYMYAGENHTFSKNCGVSVMVHVISNLVVIKRDLTGINIL
jgi:hypothetical protein